MATSFEKKLFNALKYGQEKPESIYDIWKSLGNEGTVEDFLESLRGDQGEPGASSIIEKNVSIASSKWVEYNGVYKATIVNELIKKENIVIVNFTTTNIVDLATAGILVGYVNTLTGSFEIFSKTIPDTDIVIDYVIL